LPQMKAMKSAGQTKRSSWLSKLSALVVKDLNVELRTRYAINAQKAMQALGYRPEITFEDGLQQTLLWYLENETWWRRIMDGSYRDWVDRNYQNRRAT